jgi:hypothetical protein
MRRRIMRLPNDTLRSAGAIRLVSRVVKESLETLPAIIEYSS